MFSGNAMREAKPGIALSTVKTESNKAWPVAVSTCMRPVVAPAGTRAVIELGDTVKGARTPLNVTAKTRPKRMPLRRTVVPSGPRFGAKVVKAIGGWQQRLRAP